MALPDCLFDDEATDATGRTNDQLGHVRIGHDISLLSGVAIIHCPTASVSLVVVPPNSICLMENLPLFSL